MRQRVRRLERIAREADAPPERDLRELVRHEAIAWWAESNLRAVWQQNPDMRSPIEEALAEAQADLERERSG